jgi:hypothetical protein
MTDSTLNYCYVHPTRETSLRCKRCERFICTSCARPSPTGYVCRDCVRQHQKAFDTAVWYDYVAGFSATFFLSLIASMIAAVAAMFIGFYMIFIAAGLGAGAGVFIANITLRAIQRRRSKPLFAVCTLGVILGALPVVLGLFFIGNMFALIGPVIYLVIATPTVYTRISGIQL